VGIIRKIKKNYQGKLSLTAIIITPKISINPYNFRQKGEKKKFKQNKIILNSSYNFKPNNNNNNNNKYISKTFLILLTFEVGKKKSYNKE